MGTIVLSALGTLLVVVLVLLSVPTVVLALQVLLAKRTSDEPAAASAARPRLTVLMPAHNEATGIATAISSVLPQLRVGDRLLVVADNCTDDTATIAAGSGAQVVQRQDAQRRGKGYALDCGVRHLQADPPEVVVIVDADCTLGANCLDVLACSASAGRPVQALYLMHAPPTAGLKTRLAELAWVVKNQVRPLGFHRLGLPCQLMGTGMAFPWGLIRDAKLASGHIVEDMQLGLDMTSQGTPPLFCPQARVSSTFPADALALSTQRTRWEHGHLGVMASQAPRLLWRALAHRQPLLLALVFDLCVPPLASLALLLVLALLAAAVLAAVGGSSWPLWMASLALATFAASILWAWRGFARHIVSLRELLSVPAYVLAKLPIYARLFTKRQAEWVRTKRDDGTR